MSKWEIIGIIFAFVCLIGIIYTYYGMYKITSAKCQVCDKDLESKFKKAVKFGYTLRKPKFICKNCSIPKKDNCK